jgi:Ser/Thr protein kinase RdoA (MazF antagonist)
MENANLVKLLNRTTTSVPFTQLLTEVEENYRIGKINDFQPINEGYEDANIRLITDQGIYVLKIFTADRSLENIKSYVRVLDEAAKERVPVVEMCQGKNEYLGKLKGEVGKETYYILTKFFEGENFQKKTPTIQDMVQISSIV